MDMDGSERKRRRSLTKTQIQAGAGAELLTLCQAVTADGSLSQEEVSALKTWLGENRDSDLPAIEHLTATVERIVADAVVTSEEASELYRAIETILPPEARRGAVAMRKAVAAQERQRARDEKEAERERQREEKKKRRPLESVNFMVAGVHYEGRSEIVQEHVQEEDTVFLVRDRENKFSRNAVEIRLLNGYQIGFLPESWAIRIAPLLDKGCTHEAFVTKILEGRRALIPVVQAYIYRADSGVEEAVPESAVPPKIASESVAEATEDVSAVWVILVFLAVGFVIWLALS